MILDSKNEVCSAVYAVCSCDVVARSLFVFATIELMLSRGVVFSSTIVLVVGRTDVTKVLFPWKAGSSACTTRTAATYFISCTFRGSCILKS